MAETPPQPAAALSPQQAHIVTQWQYDRPLVSCRFDPQGRFVFAGAEDNSVQRWDLATGHRTTLAGHESWVRSIEFSSDGEFVITAGYDGRLVWWPAAAEKPQPVRTVEAHKGWVRSISRSPDGRLLATCGNDLFVRIWSAADGTLVRELPGHERYVYAVQFHPDGHALLSGDIVGSLKQWDTSTWQVARTFDAKALHSYNGGQQVDFGGIRTIAVSPDGKHVAAGGLHKASNPLGAVHEPLALLFDWQSQSLVRSHVAEGIPGGVLWRLAWLRDGSLMGTSGGSSGGFLLFWKPEADKDYHRFQLPNLARDMDLHPDCVQVATAHADRHIRITRLSAKTG